MTNDLVPQTDAGVLSVSTLVAQKTAIHDVMKTVMKEKVHYGVIPGCQKPSLYQPGAELLCMTFRLVPHFDVQEISRPGEFTYRATCSISTGSGVFLGSAVGECSTSETKYMWRSAVCDEEFNDTPDNMRRVLWKKGYNNSPPTQVRQVRTNPADLANTASAIAQKRAFVRAVRTVTAASDVFDVNIEDLQGVADIDDDAGGAEHKPIQRPQAKKQDAAPESLTVTGVVAAVSAKPTSKEGTTRTSCKINEAWYATFDDRVADVLVKGANLTLTYEVNKFGNNILTAEAAQ